jgi:DNA invertase Pin-like site-specific DNA recombinase
LLSTLLAPIAEFERELIRERTGEGRKRAMAAGVKFGRKPKLNDYQRAEAIARRAAGEMRDFRALRVCDSDGREWGLRTYSVMQRRRGGIDGALSAQPRRFFP